MASSWCGLRLENPQCFWRAAKTSWGSLVFCIRAGAKDSVGAIVGAGDWLLCEAMRSRFRRPESGCRDAVILSELPGRVCGDFALPALRQSSALPAGELHPQHADQAAATRPDSVHVHEPAPGG